MDTDWMAEARCSAVPTSAFFPGDGKGVEAARTICALCAVRHACLEYALANHINDGVWGGASERERRRILRERRIRRVRRLPAVDTAAPAERPTTAGPAPAERATAAEPAPPGGGVVRWPVTADTGPAGDWPAAWLVVRRQPLNPVTADQ